MRTEAVGEDERLLGPAHGAPPQQIRAHRHRVGVARHELVDLLELLEQQQLGQAVELLLLRLDNRDLRCAPPSGPGKRVGACASHLSAERDNRERLDADAQQGADDHHGGLALTVGEVPCRARVTARGRVCALATPRMDMDTSNARETAYWRRPPCARFARYFLRACA